MEKLASRLRVCRIFRINIGEIRKVYKTCHAKLSLVFFYTRNEIKENLSREAPSKGIRQVITLTKVITCLIPLDGA